MKERELDYVIDLLKERIRISSLIGDGFDVTLNWKLADDVLALLIKQQEEIKDLKATVCLMEHDVL